MSAATPVGVTIVVTTKNNETTIESCLASCRAQRDVTVELIVVDNHSSDATVGIASATADLVMVAGPERSAQRNLGVRHASHDVILIIDSDMTLGAYVAADVAALIGSDESIGAVIVPELAAGSSLHARARALEKVCYLGDASVEAARGFRRSAFLEVGGFDETLWGAEDWDLSDRVKAAGWRLRRATATITHHEVEAGLRELFRKKRYYGFSTGRQRAAAQRRGDDVRPLARTALLKQWRVLRGDPAAALTLVVIKAVEAAGIFTGMRDHRVADQTRELVKVGSA